MPSLWQRKGGTLSYCAPRTNVGGGRTGEVPIRFTTSRGGAGRARVVFFWRLCLGLMAFDRSRTTLTGLTRRRLYSTIVSFRVAVYTLTAVFLLRSTFCRGMVHTSAFLDFVVGVSGKGGIGTACGSGDGASVPGGGRHHSQGTGAPSSFTPLSVLAVQWRRLALFDQRAFAVEARTT